MLNSLKRVLVGRPLATAAEKRERLGKITGLAVFSSDAVSSVAYGPEEVLLALVTAGTGALAFSIPIRIGISILVVIVASSYWQTIHAYASIELAVDAMKLGALDFVRKPMTPEIVRNAVTAALARPTAAPPAPMPLEGAPERAYPPIARLTLNGFRLWPAPGPEAAQTVDPSTRPFVVRHPDG